MWDSGLLLRFVTFSRTQPRDTLVTEAGHSAYLPRGGSGGGSKGSGGGSVSKGGGSGAAGKGGGGGGGVSGMMVAPRSGGATFISRGSLESNPQGYFSGLHSSGKGNK
ncbi:loricrin-like [Durio zibethinus]|uniref:Loricrin-like n=1 Tax=Durio zibethinus TaxID=66656 RepID=A0A6P5WVJ1_DURZI|nr:loricrin-like [Durio zibethinus]